MDKAQAQELADKIAALPYRDRIYCWASGGRTARLEVEGARVVLGDVHIRFLYEGSRFDAPSGLRYDGEELHVEGLEDLSHRKREACVQAMGALEDIIWDMEQS